MLKQLNDINISNIEDIEDLMTEQKREEIDLIAKNTLIEAEQKAAFDKQIAALEANQVIEKQNILRIQIQRTQRRQAKIISKAQRVASKNREKVYICMYILAILCAKSKGNIPFMCDEAIISILISEKYINSPKLLKYDAKSYIYYVTKLTEKVYIHRYLFYFYFFLKKKLSFLKLDDASREPAYSRR